MRTLPFYTAIFVLIGASTASAQNPAQVKWVMTTKDDIGLSAAESPTGLLLLEGAGVVVHNPATGERVQIAERKSGAAVWSPNGDRIAFLVYEGQASSVWSVPVDRNTGKPAAPPQRVSVTTVRTGGHISFSPDGRSILAVVGRGKLIAIPATGGTERTIVDEEKFSVRDPAWSADGNIYYVASEGATGSWIRAVPAKLPQAKSRRVLRATDLMGVSRDGRLIAYYDGGPPYMGSPLKIATPDGKILSTNLMPIGTYFGKWSGRSNHFVFAQLDIPAGVKRVDFASKALQSLTPSASYDRLPAYSPDGNFIALQRKVNGQYQLAVMRADGSDVRLLSATANASRSPLLWSPDGRFIAYMTSAVRHAVVDVKSGKKSLLGQDSSVSGNAAWRSDSKALRYVSLAAMPAYSAVREATLGGADRELSRITLPAWSIKLFSDDTFLKATPAGFELLPYGKGEGRTFKLVETVLDVSVSPDRKWMAAGFERGSGQGIRLISLETGAARDLTAEFPCGLYNTKWHPDGRNLVVGSFDCGAADRQNGTAIRSDYTLVPLDGGSPFMLTGVDKEAVDIGDISISPDGRRMIFGSEAPYTYKVGDIDFTRLTAASKPAPPKTAALNPAARKPAAPKSKR